MKIFPVALALFYRKTLHQGLEVWTQVRTDDGPLQGLLEFPGGGVENGETPLKASVREVEEEVGIKIDINDGQFMGNYSHVVAGKTIILSIFLYPPHEALEKVGTWLNITETNLSKPFEGKIPGPNHQIIDDLYRALYSEKQ